MCSVTNGVRQPTVLLAVAFSLFGFANEIVVVYI